MKKFIRAKFLTVSLLGASTAFAGNVGMDVNIHVGDQPRQVVVREPVTPPPAPELLVSGDIHFILPGALGFYVAVDLPYDLFYLHNHYYLYRDGHWSRSRNSRGPWTVIGRRELPPSLRRHEIKKIRHYRDREYVVYKRDRDNYRGRHFRSGRDDWREQRRDETRERQHGNVIERDERRHDKGGRRD